MSSCFKEIAAELRDHNYLTVPSHDTIVDSAAKDGCSKLTEEVLNAINIIDPVTVFVEFVESSKRCGNRTYIKFIEGIEDKCKELYRGLLKCSSGELVLIGWVIVSDIYCHALSFNSANCGHFAAQASVLCSECNIMSFLLVLGLYHL